MAHELARYNVDIAALSETRFSEEGALVEEGSGYTFFWKGYPASEPRQHGVGFALKTSIAQKLTEEPRAISERLMTLRLPLVRDKYCTIISAYAPTLCSDDDVKDSFYNLLDHTVSRIDKRDKLVLMGDFNARVGRDFQMWEGVLGRHGVGKMNSNGLRLLTFCTEHELTISNSLFQMPNKYKTSWMHPRSKQWHLLDYIIVRRASIGEVKITRAMRGADFSTDHRMILSKISLSVRPRSRMNGAKKKVNCGLLHNSHHREEYMEAVKIKLNSAGGADMEDLDQKWSQISDVLKSAGLEVLGASRKRHRDWFDESDQEVAELLRNKNTAHRSALSHPKSAFLRGKFAEVRAETQRRLREVENNWWLSFAQEIQSYADTNDIHKFYETLRATVGPVRRPSTPVRSISGELLRNQDEILNRWKEHFSTLLNETSDCDPSILEDLPLIPVDEQLWSFPEREEVVNIIESLKNNKTPGPDGVAAELLKCGPPELVDALLDMVRRIWNSGTVPQTWKDANLVTIYKNKGDRAECGNSRGIALLAVAGKILAKLINRRVANNIAEKIIPESQCGFRPNRGTCDMIFVARQLQEKCREQHVGMYMAFVDLSKAFDRVPRDLLWSILRRFGCPDNIVAIIRGFHEGMKVRVSAYGTLSDEFEVTTGVKQGCVMAPVLFNLFMLCVTHLLHREADGEGVDVRYRLDRNLFDLSKLKARTRTKMCNIKELQYADDAAIVAHSPEVLQHMIDILHQTYNRLGLKMNTDKTEVMQLTDGDQDVNSITVGTAQLKNVSDFRYLGSYLSSDWSLDKEVTYRIGRAAAAFGSLRERVFSNRNLKLTTKINVYNAVCLSTLLYGTETWTLYRCQTRKLEAYHIQCLQRILNISWRDKVTHNEILRRTGSKSLEYLAAQRQLRWVGHVIRMEDERLPKQVLYGELVQGQRLQGGQKKRYKDFLKVTLKKCHINPKDLELLARDRAVWRQTSQLGLDELEKDRRDHRDLMRRRRHERAAQPGMALDSLACHICQRVCLSRIGLVSHLRMHDRRGTGELAVIVDTDGQP